MRAAGVLLMAEDTGRVLLCRRVEDGYWSVPGGVAELGESDARTARRELAEETGYRGSLHGMRRPCRVVGDFTLFFATVECEFAPKLNDEHDRWGWYDPLHHPQPLHPGLGGVLVEL